MTVLFQCFDFGERGADFACGDVGPSDETVLLVEEEVTLGVALGDKKRGCRRVVVEGEEVGIGEDINVVNEDGVSVGEETSSLLESPTRLEQHIGFVAETDVNVEGVIGFDKVDDLLGEVMNIDDDFCHSDGFQLLDEYLYKGFATNGHHCLGHSVGEGFETSAETGCEDERVHEN